MLDSCGINYASIYPDLTGLARHIYWRYKWGLQQSKPRVATAPSAQEPARRSKARTNA